MNTYLESLSERKKTMNQNDPRLWLIEQIKPMLDYPGICDMAKLFLLQAIEAQMRDYELENEKAL
jgi:hypothetical protein